MEKNEAQQAYYVNEHSILPTLSCTFYYNIINPMKIPLMNNPTDNKLCDSLNFQLTTTFHLNQLTTIGLSQIPSRFIAQKANRFSFNHYDHTVTRYMEDSPYDNDPNYNPQLNEKFFSNSVYFFHLNSPKINSNTI